MRNLKKNVYEYIKKNVQKRNIYDGKENLQTFVNMLQNRHINVIDEKVLLRLYNEEDFLDKELLTLILETLEIKEPIQYFSRYFQDMNASGYSGTEKAIIIDELLEYTILSFIFTMYSLANDNSEENIIRCMKNFYVLEDLQNCKKKIGIHNENQFYEMSILPKNLMHTAMDTYWTIWTFLIGHELYHIIHLDDHEGKETELRADQYAYRLLIKLIIKQKKNKIPKTLKVFWECQYLSPIILFEMFRLFDVYSKLKGKNIVYKEHPSPEERQNNIYSMFENDIPENMNTEEGNILLNLILNSSEYAENWLCYKIKKGKL